MLSCRLINLTHKIVPLCISDLSSISCISVFIITVFLPIGIRKTSAGQKVTDKLTLTRVSYMNV